MRHAGMAAILILPASGQDGPDLSVIDRIRTEALDRSKVLRVKIVVLSKAGIPGPATAMAREWPTSPEDARSHDMLPTS